MTATLVATTTAHAYAIDKMHSEVGFRVRHLLTRVHGRFSDFTGTILIDQENPENSSTSLTIDASSVDTRTADRDQHLRSADFFAVDTYPTITFKSSHIVRKSADTYHVNGTLTIRGIAKEITLPVTYLGTAKDPWGNARVGFEGTVRINRKDFGLIWNAALETGGFLVGDDVQVNLSIQAIAQ